MSIILRMTRRINPLLVGTASILVIALLGGCSHFDQEWQAAGTRPPTGIEGRWQGKWVSEVDGHSGAIRCASAAMGRTPT